MITLYRKFTPILLCLLGFATPLSAQWDPQGDAALFTYVFPLPGRYINDHSLIRSDSLWHLFYIDGEMGGYWDRAGNEVRIGHATSPNLRDWTPHDSALGIGPPRSLDRAHVYAPGVIEKDGTYYMFYTGNEAGYPHGEHMFLATSPDLFTWTRYQKDPIFLPDTSWAAYHPPGYAHSSGGPLSGRDPYVFFDERHGHILYYVAKLRSSDPKFPDSGYSCIAAATSSDLINWTDRGPLVVRKTTHLEQGTSWNHPESPCLIKHDDTYYLFWKGGPGTRYVKSDDPLDFTGAEEYRLATSHSSKIVEWQGSWYITSCSRDVSDITHERSDRTRGLYLAKLRWYADRPHVISLDDTNGVPFTADVLQSMTLYPNPVAHGSFVSIRLPEGSGSGEYDVDIIDIRTMQVFRNSLMSVAGDDGGRWVDVPTSQLSAGVYVVRAGSGMARLVVL